MDVAPQPFVPPLSLGRDAVAVPLRHHPSHSREILVHKPDCNAKAPAENTDRGHIGLPEHLHCHSFQSRSALQSMSSVPRQESIAQVRLMRPQDCRIRITEASAEVLQSWCWVLIGRIFQQTTDVVGRGLPGKRDLLADLPTKFWLLPVNVSVIRVSKCHGELMN